MILTIHVPGTTVKQDQKSLVVRIPPEKTPRTRDEYKDGLPDEFKPRIIKVSVHRLTSVVIAGNTGITMPVLKLLSKHAVPVILLDRNRPVAVINPYAAHGSVEVRKKQFKAIEDERGFDVAKSIIDAGLENKARLLLLLAKNRNPRQPQLASLLRSAAKGIRIVKEKLDHVQWNEDITTVRYKLMGVEGEGSRLYFSTLHHVLPPAFAFTGRNRRPPKDPVNAILSLGYTIMQGFITTAVASVGLEPYAGFLHADRSGKPSLVLDLMEEFRQPIVDRLVLKLVNTQILKINDFTADSRGVRLTKSGLDEFFRRILKRLAPMRQTELARLDEHNYYDEILYQSRKLSRFLMGRSGSYKPYIMDW